MDFKAMFSKENMMDAVAVLAGYLVAKIVIAIVTPYLSMVGTYARVVTAVIAVVVAGLIPMRRKYLVVGAMVVLFTEILKAVGVDIEAIVVSAVSGTLKV